MVIAVLDAEPVIPIAVRVVATDVAQVVADFVAVVVVANAAVVVETEVQAQEAEAAEAAEVILRALIAPVNVAGHV